MSLNILAKLHLFNFASSFITSQTTDTLRARFELAQNKNSDFVE